MLAPIVLFAYNRADHLKRTVEALAQNPEAKDSVVYIFSDGPRQKVISAAMNDDEREQTLKKNEESVLAVGKVREYIHSIPERGIFKDVTIVEAPQNKGLATSVITGVDRVIREHGNVIVVEDDAVCAPTFLRFMNDALAFYQSYTNKIWMVGGYCPRLTIPEDYAHDFYLMGRGSSFAWGTWLDRWEKIDWAVGSYPSFKRNLRLRKAFNLYGEDRSNMLDCQMLGKIDSWAIRFSFEMFRNKMYSILPTYSLIQTIGRDGSGTHTTGTCHNFDVDLKDAPSNVVFSDVEMDWRIVKQHVRYFKRSKRYLVKEFLFNCLLGKSK